MSENKILRCIVPYWVLEISWTFTIRNIIMDLKSSTTEYTSRIINTLQIVKCFKSRLGNYSFKSIFAAR